MRELQAKGSSELCRASLQRFWRVEPWLEWENLRRRARFSRESCLNLPSVASGARGWAQLDALAPFLSPDFEKSAQ